MTQEELQQYIEDHGIEDAILLEDPSFSEAFIGTTHDERVVYSYTRMVEQIMTQYGKERSEAVSYIDFHTLRELPYMGANAPIVMFDIEE